jgi:hypothetical protein
MLGTTPLGDCGIGAVCWPLGVWASGAWALAAMAPYARIAAVVAKTSMFFRISTSTQGNTPKLVRPFNLARAVLILRPSVIS